MTYELPDWARLFIPGFREAKRTIQLAAGFTLIPVDVPGPDVAHALGYWLAEEGFPPRVIAPLDDEGWNGLVAALFEDMLPEVIPMVVGMRQPPPGVYAGLRLLNQRRDTVARHLGRPLLWCGPLEFHKLTWERAPDFWSIRSMPVVLKEPPAHASEPPLWPEEHVTDPPERLRGMLDMALSQGDLRNGARVANLLAERLMALSKLDDAEDVLLEVIKAPPDPRLALTRAMLLARQGDREGAALLLSLPDNEVEPSLLARRLICEGNLVFSSDRKAARERYEAALFTLRGGGDRVAEAIAVANVGVLELADGELDDARDKFEEALVLVRESGDARSEAQILDRLGAVHLLQRDSSRAAQCFEDALTLFREVRDRQGEAEVLRRLARAYLYVGDPEKALDDSESALRIARALGDKDGEDEAVALSVRARDELEDD